ncbi:MAG TPA: SRPBCC family protein [Candidatus Aquilonibacter sp.]
MATIRKSVLIDIPPERAWDAIRDVGNLHVRLFPHMLSDTVLEGDERIVTFADGRSVRETIVTVDDGEMRVAYAIIGGALRHYAAAVEVTPKNERSLVQWTVDLLPNEAAERISRVMDGGLADMKSTLEAF